MLDKLTLFIANFFLCIFFALKGFFSVWEEKEKIQLNLNKLNITVFLQSPFVRWLSKDIRQPLFTAFMIFTTSMITSNSQSSKSILTEGEYLCFIIFVTIVLILSALGNIFQYKNNKNGKSVLVNEEEVLSRFRQTLITMIIVGFAYYYIKPPTYENVLIIFAVFVFADLASLYYIRVQKHGKNKSECEKIGLWLSK